MKNKMIPTLLSILLVFLAFACSSSTPAATPNTQATVDAALAATAQAQTDMQVTIDAAIAATAAAVPPTPTPGPTNEYVELTEEELAAMIDQAVNDAVAASTEASTATTQATSDDSMTSEEVQVVIDTVFSAEEVIAYADELIGAYYELYGELATETLSLLTEVEQDLDEMASGMEALASSLLEIENTLEQGLVLAEETIDQLENTAQQTTANLNQIQEQVKNWVDKAQMDRDHRANSVAGIKPDNVPADLQSTLQAAFDFVDRIHGALGDNKLSRDELNGIAQLGANVAAGFSSHGGPRMSGLSGKINELTGQLARGQVPAAKRGLDDFERSLGDRPGGSRPGRP